MEHMLIRLQVYLKSTAFRFLPFSLCNSMNRNKRGERLHYNLAYTLKIPLSDRSRAHLVCDCELTRESDWAKKKKKVIPDEAGDAACRLF